MLDERTMDILRGIAGRDDEAGKAVRALLDDKAVLLDISERVRGIDDRLRAVEADGRATVSSLTGALQEIIDNGAETHDRLNRIGGGLLALLNELRRIPPFLDKTTRRLSFLRTDLQSRVGNIEVNLASFMHFVGKLVVAVGGPKASAEAKRIEAEEKAVADAEGKKKPV